jgi:hypothetical protein
MVTQKQQNDLLVGPKVTMWILGICLVMCLIAGMMGQRTHQTSTAQEVDQTYPNVVDQGQVGTSSPEAPRGPMYELREQPGAGNTSPGGSADRVPVLK